MNDELVEVELEELLAIPGNGTRLRCMLVNSNIKTMNQLLTMTEAEFLRTPNVGRVCLGLLKAELKARGLYLGYPAGKPSPQRSWWDDVLNEQT